MLKQLGFDDVKLEAMMTLIATMNANDTYTTGLQLEPDVTPVVIKRKKAA